MEKEQVVDEKKENKIKSGLLENILVFFVIPLVLFLLFLHPNANNLKRNNQDLLFGSWKMGNETLEFYTDGTYSLNKKKGKVERKNKNEVYLTSHGIFFLKVKKERLEFTNAQGKKYVWMRNNITYPGVWVAKSNSILAFTGKNYFYYNGGNNPQGIYKIKNQTVSLDKVGAPGKWDGTSISWGGDNVYQKILNQEILPLTTEMIEGSWQTVDGRILTFYNDGTYTFPNTAQKHKAYSCGNCGVLLDGIPGLFVLTSKTSGAWCGKGTEKPLNYTRN